MTIKNKLQDPNLTTEERDLIIGSFVRKHEKEKLKEHYARILDKEHGIRRSKLTSEVAPARIINLKFLLAVAASLILAFTLYTLSPASGGEDLLAGYLTERSEFVPLTRSDNGGNAVLEAYQRGDYAGAVAGAASVPEAGNVVNYFVGQSHLALENYAEARAAFGSVLPEGNYAEEAAWFALLIDLKLSETADQSAAVIRALEAYQPTDFYYDKAQKLLSTLK